MLLLLLLLLLCTFVPRSRADSLRPPFLIRLLLALTTSPCLILTGALDSLSMKKHVIKICRTTYFELKVKRISSTRKFLTEDAAKTPITSYMNQ